MAGQKWKSEKRTSSPYSNFARYSGLGFQWVISIGLLGYLGFWIDTQINTLPLFLLLFVMLALFGNIYLVIRNS